jgi:hypothetical protein
MQSINLGWTSSEPAICGLLGYEDDRRAAKCQTDQAAMVR